jgi:hypothetical protein
VVDVGGVGREGSACAREDRRAAAPLTVCRAVSAV